MAALQWTLGRLRRPPSDGGTSDSDSHSWGSADIEGMRTEDLQIHEEADEATKVCRRALGSCRVAGKSAFKSASVQ